MKQIIIIILTLSIISNVLYSDNLNRVKWKDKSLPLKKSIILRNFGTSILPFSSAVIASSVYFIFISIYMIELFNFDQLYNFSKNVFKAMNNTIKDGMPIALVGTFFYIGFGGLIFGTLALATSLSFLFIGNYKINKLLKKVSFEANRKYNIIAFNFYYN